MTRIINPKSNSILVFSDSVIVYPIKGEMTHTVAAHLSLIFHFVSSPKEYKPNKGPYVYPANKNNFAITLSFAMTYLKINITKISTIDNKK